MKKLFTILIATILSFSAFAEVSIYNELGTNTVRINKDKTQVGTFYNETDVTFSHEKITARVDAMAWFDPDPDVNDLSVLFVEWYTTLHALPNLDLSMNNKYRSNNSKFTIRWEDVSFARIGPEGVSATLLFDKLKVNLGVPFQNYSEKNTFSLSAGTAYDFENFQVSTVIEKKRDDFALGAWFASKWVNVGYGHNHETLGLTGGNIVALSSYPVFGGFEPGVEFATNFKGDFYFGVQANYRINNFLIRTNAWGNYVNDLLTYQVEGGLSYFFKDHHEICAKLRLNITDKTVDTISVPVYWAYFY